VQECEWQPIKEYFDAHADPASKKKLRSLSQKKAYLLKKGFKIQKAGSHDFG